MDPPVGNIKLRLARMFHRHPLLRRIAKPFFRGTVIRQPFHGGLICLDAVEHSWGWAGDNTYENFDRPLQDGLLRLSLERPWLVDIGSNLGAMTLGTLLRNPQARAVAADPNRRAHQLLRKSLRLNGLADRAKLVTAAIAPAGVAVRFDFTGSVVGHVTPTGTGVPTVTVAGLIDLIPPDEEPLIKCDIEGFESQILPDLALLGRARNAILVVELHPKGMNGWGDPVGGFGELLSSGAHLSDIEGRSVTDVDPSAITQVVAKWA
jgi:FkbM family methyltransferase